MVARYTQLLLFKKKKINKNKIEKKCVSSVYAYLLRTYYCIVRSIHNDVGQRIAYSRITSYLFRVTDNEISDITCWNVTLVVTTCRHFPPI